MKLALLDTSFIVTCVKQKIDFLDEIPMLGFQIIVPKQVMVELEGLSKQDSNAKVGLDLIKKSGVKVIDLKSRDTDSAIISHSKTHEGVVVATLDKEIKERTPGQNIIIRGKNKLELV